ncbi:bifunctional WD40-repeat-containing domain superfamily/WD40 repeat/G-protein beta WD-40 repeat/Coatomer [Babesia duncani]|uniref:Coatomer subunit beta' n=1 Tax=Babesia duncani TaxID=323732 RepID=A0AAD9UPZ6_9APIC|nr:bifunctional WD40-repeat-containing domain superfamily/WD40 repeat/G-protein beta WD-40 repeat/Coatomer [Babesia duncani]
MVMSLEIIKMSQQMGFRKKLEIRSKKVKCVDIHPFEPWVASALYNGSVTIYNYKTQSLLKKIDICNSSLRCCKFIARKQWIIAAGDENYIWVHNYNSLERVHQVDAHVDYIRCLELHPNLSLVISCSDDMKICIWDCEKNWERLVVCEGHQHYVMMCRWNPKEPNLFASCSLDHTIKFWGVSMDVLEGKTVGMNITSPFFTLSGHKAGVNSIDFSTNLSLPYIVSGSDDFTIRVWDYQTKLCLQTLNQHTNCVMSVRYHPRLPLIITSGQDSQIHLWHSSLYKTSRVLQYNMGSVWALACNNNDLAIGTDSGTVVVQLGGDVPLVSMHLNKLVMVKSFDIITCNISSLVIMPPCNRVSLDFRNIGSCDFFPQAISHHPNGRFICLCGDSEYVIYTAQGMRSKTYGKASQLVWSPEGHYATYNNSLVVVYHDFVEKHQIQASGIYKIIGGRLLALVNSTGVSFYDWDRGILIHTIDAQVENIWWNSSGTRVAIACPGNVVILKFDNSLLTSLEVDPEATFEGAFELEHEILQCVHSAIWAFETFVYTTASMHLNLYSWRHIETLCYLEQQLHLIGYSEQEEKLFLCDEDIHVQELSHSILHLHSIVVRQCQNLTGAIGEIREHLANLAEPQLERATRLLEAVGCPELALEFTSCNDRKFELHLKLGHIDECLELLNSSLGAVGTKWQLLSRLCMEKQKYELAASCCERAKLHSNALLLHLVNGNVEGLEKIANETRDANVAFTANYMLNRVEKCIEILHATNRHAEATLMARTFRPSLVPLSLKTWTQSRRCTPKLSEDVNLQENEKIQEAMQQRLAKGFPASNQYAKLKEAIHADVSGIEIDHLKEHWL